MSVVVFEAEMIKDKPSESFVSVNLHISALNFCSCKYVFVTQNMLITLSKYQPITSDFKDGILTFRREPSKLYYSAFL